MGVERMRFGLALALVLGSGTAPAVEMASTPDFTLNIHPQIQARFEADFDGPPGVAAPSGHANLDFFIRRVRLLTNGTAYKQFTFAILINAVNLGQRGNYNVAPFVQDAFIGYVPAD